MVFVCLTSWLVEEILEGSIFPGVLLSIYRPDIISAILQFAQFITSAVSNKVILKLLEFPKNCGLPIPLKERNRLPDYAGFV